MRSEHQTVVRSNSPRDKSLSLLHPHAFLCSLKLAFFYLPLYRNMAYTPFPWLLEYLSLSYVAAAILLYYFIVVSYRLTLHPLAGFPGPKLAASSLLYEYYYDGICWGRFWVKLQELHEQYGMATSWFERMLLTNY